MSQLVQRKVRLIEVFCVFEWLPLYHDLVEGNDYAVINETVTLTPGQPLNREFTAMVINDDRLESRIESFEIRMELADPPSFAMVELDVESIDVGILDDDCEFVWDF